MRWLLVLLMLFVSPCLAGEEEAIAALKTSGVQVHKLKKGGVYVSLDGDSVSLQRLKRLDEIPGISHVNLRTERRDDKLPYIKTIKTIAILEVSGNGFRDADMKHIAEMSSLTRLTVTSNALTDRGLLEVAKIPGLKLMQARSLTVTQAGREKLNELLPKCVVE